MSGHELVEWSLFPGKPSPTSKSETQNAYLIRRQRGLSNSSHWSFSVKFNVGCS